MIASPTARPGRGGPSLGIADFVSIGSYNLVCVLLGMGLGWWADTASGLTPILTLTGLALGVAVGVLGSWLRIRPLLAGSAAGGIDGTDDGKSAPQRRG